MEFAINVSGDVEIGGYGANRKYSCLAWFESYTSRNTFIVDKYAVRIFAGGAASPSCCADIGTLRILFVDGPPAFFRNPKESLMVVELSDPVKCSLLLSRTARSKSDQSCRVSVSKWVNHSPA